MARGPVLSFALVLTMTSCFQIYLEIKDTEDTFKLQKDRDQLYDANNKETDKKDPRFIYSGGNCPQKCRKHQVSWGRYHK